MGPQQPQGMGSSKLCSSSDDCAGGGSVSMSRMTRSTMLFTCAGTTASVRLSSTGSKQA